jgi:hypothetical protein
MRNKLVSIIVLATAYIFTVSGVAAAQGIYVSGTNGVDVSYPNCKTKITGTAFGIVGVTGGLFYQYNDCLAPEAANFSNLSLYTNTGWNDKSPHIDQNSPIPCGAGDSACLAYNYGYNAAKDALSYAGSQGVSSPTWWLDVETANTWNSDVYQNRSSLQGSYDALKDSGVVSVGAYSTTYQWGVITGGWQNNWPNWGATTVRTAKQAASYCKGHQFTGGLTYLIQYSGKLDQDYAC